MAPSGSFEADTATTPINASQTPISEGAISSGSDRQNPWGQPTASVAFSVDLAVDNASRHEQFLNQSIEYWNDMGDTHTAHEVRFTRADERGAADILITARPTIADCQRDEARSRFKWCTDVYDEDDRAPDQTVAAVSARYAADQTAAYYRGVMGSMLGVDDPTQLPSIQVAETPSLRDPWPESNPVVVGVSNQVNDSREFPPLVTETLRYWEDGEGSSYSNYHDCGNDVPVIAVRRGVSQPHFATTTTVSSGATSIRQFRSSE